MMDTSEQHNGVEDIAAQLRAARAAAGASLEEISGELCIRRSYLEAMEAGRFDDLPPPAYTSGFLRSYAQALGLDAQAMSCAYRTAMGERALQAELQFPEPIVDSRMPGRGTIAAGLAGLALIYVGWIHDFSGAGPEADSQVAEVPERLSVIANAMATPSLDGAGPAETESAAAGDGAAGADDDDDTEAVEAAARDEALQSAPPNAELAVADPETLAAPAMSASDDLPADTPVAGNAAAQEGDRVTLTAERDAWLYVVDSMNREVWKGVLREGESWSPDREGLILMTGNAGGVLVSVGGRPARPLGAKGAVLKGLPLDAQSLTGRQGG